MQEIAPGIHHWKTFHEPIGAEVSSYLIEPAGIVIDPKVPEHGLDELPVRPQQVVLTSGHHLRDAMVFAEELGIPVRASRQAAEHIGAQDEIATFEDGDEVAPGVTAIHIGKLSDDEGALYIEAGGGAIALADALNRYGEALGFFPDELLGDHPERVKAGLMDAFTGLLERDFEHLLFAHGEPLVGKGKSALREFVQHPVGQEHFGQQL